MPNHRVPGTRRVWLPAFFFGLFAIAIAGRLVQVQILEHGDYARQAEVELLGDATLYSRRGSILDRNGAPLATSVDTWDIYVNSRVWKEAARSREVAEALGPLLDVAPEELLATVRGSEAVDVLIARDVEYETGKLIISGGFAGVIALPNTARVHPERDIAATILGFIGQDNTGLTGIEARYNDILQGKPGKAIYERDSTGEPIPFGRRVRVAPTPGRDVVLTIDRYLQRLAENTLEKTIADHRARGGTILIMDVDTGDILAMATSPGMKFSTLNLDDPAQTEFFRERAITDLYEPGSVMKVITAAAAIDAGLVSPDTTYVDTGVAYVYGVPIRNWDYQVYGQQTMTGVLQHSINTGAIFMVQKLGERLFHRYLDAFGFGSRTGIDLSGEAEGIIRRPWDPQWSPVDLMTQSFGQSISVTPIQMATAIAAAINGGKLMRPNLVKAYISEDGTREEVQPKVVRQAISPQTSATIRQMLTQVVNPGTWHPAQPQAYMAGGKSGTANVPVPNGYDERTVASFVGFAPADDPRILVMVKIDENEDRMTGTQAAGPVFASLVDASLAYLNVRPDNPKYVAER
jgi:stage V sporulation protein D (sporulation-specific penicillin-binding protein)